MTKLANRLPFEFSCHKLRHNFATNYCIDEYIQRGQVDIYKLMILLADYLTYSENVIFLKIKNL